MRQEIITLPSTCQLEMRQIMLREENKMSSAMKSKKQSLSRVMSEVLTSCTVGVIDPGPYSFLEVGGAPNWDDMAKGDRFAAMIELRCISYTGGEMYDAELRCPELTCRNKFVWQVDLKKDLFWQMFSSESVSRLKTGEPFETVIAGKKVKYTIALGKTDRLFRRLCTQHQGREMSAALRSRIVEVEGLKASEIMDWLDGERGRYEGLSSDDAEELRNAFDLVDGGVDTTTEATCPRCSTDFEFSLPFSGIFLPGKEIATRKRKEREKAERMREMPEGDWEEIIDLDMPVVE